MNKKLFFIVSIIAVLILTACGNQQVETVPSEDESATASLSVYTTVYPLQYFAERIGGEHVHVQSIYPPGADEHSFDPTQKDMIALADSDLFFYVGLGLEGFVDKAELTLKGEHVKMIATAEGIAEEMLHEGHDHEADAEQDEHHHGQLDPHVWISPVLSIELATSIKNALIEELPEIKKNSRKTSNY